MTVAMISSLNATLDKRARKKPAKKLLAGPTYRAISMQADVIIVLVFLFLIPHNTLNARSLNTALTYVYIGRYLCMLSIKTVKAEHNDKCLLRRMRYRA